MKYRSSFRKFVNHNLRIRFLENCDKTDIVPIFLKFRIPNNGCFDDRYVRDFQKRLLKKEIIQAKVDMKDSMQKVNIEREKVKMRVPYKCYPSVILHTRCFIKEFRSELGNKLNSKLHRLSREQERPLFNVENTAVSYTHLTLPTIYSV